MVVDVCQTCTCDLYISRVKRQMEEKEAEDVSGSHISYFTSVEEWTLITSNVIYQRERDRH